LTNENSPPKSASGDAPEPPETQPRSGGKRVYARLDSDVTGEQLGELIEDMLAAIDISPYPQDLLQDATMSELPGRLADLLDGLLEEREHFLVVSVEPPGYYVQFLPQADGGLYAEAVSNEFLDEAARLTPEARACLEQFGWLLTGPNYSQAWGSPVPVAEVAHLAVQTLTEVYALGSPSRLFLLFGKRTATKDV